MGRLLECKANTDAALKEVKDSWKDVGVCIACDSWTDSKGHPQLNFLAVNTIASVFLFGVDCGTEKKGAEFIAGHLKTAMVMVGTENVVGLLMDGASANVNAASIIAREYPKVQWIRCGSAQTLDKLVLSEDWEEYVKGKPKMKDAWDTIIDKEFWMRVGTVLDVLRPVYKLLRNVDGNQEVMGKIYDKMFALEDAVKEACKELTEEEKEDVTDIVRNRWNNDINCALHVVGRILYPPNQYESIFGTDVECTKIFKKFIRNYYKGEFVKVGGVTAPLATIVEKEVLTYIKGKGDIGEQKARDEHELIKAGLLDSAHWWEFNGTDVPHLSKLAKRVLKQCVSASPCETKWAVWESIHTARRNRLGAKRLADLVYVSHNYHTVKKLNEDLAKKLVVSGLPVVQVKEEPTDSYGHLDDDDIPDEAYLDGQEAEEPMDRADKSEGRNGCVWVGQEVVERGEVVVVTGTDPGRARAREGPALFAGRVNIPASRLGVLRPALPRPAHVIACSVAIDCCAIVPRCGQSDCVLMPAPLTALLPSHFPSPRVLLSNPPLPPLLNISFPPVCWWHDLPEMLRKKEQMRRAMEAAEAASDTTALHGVHVGHGMEGTFLSFHIPANKPFPVIPPSPFSQLPLSFPSTSCSINLPFPSLSCPFPLPLTFPTLYSPFPSPFIPLPFPLSSHFLSTSPPLPLPCLPLLPHFPSPSPPLLLPFPSPYPLLSLPFPSPYPPPPLLIPFPFPPHPLSSHSPGNIFNHISFILPPFLPAALLPPPLFPTPPVSRQLDNCINLHMPQFIGGALSAADSCYGGNSSIGAIPLLGQFLYWGNSSIGATALLGQLLYWGNCSIGATALLGQLLYCGNFLPAGLL
ncbi:unnamed protein product [Closterium sp. NIES-65]|nr:unnamed protein product [Closterium sp. NIES-65]